MSHGDDSSDPQGADGDEDRTVVAQAAAPPAAQRAVPVPAASERTIVAALEPKARPARPAPVADFGKTTVSVPPAAGARAPLMAQPPGAGRPSQAPPGAPGAQAMVPAQAGAAAALVKGHALFRRESLEANLAAVRDAEVLRVAPPWSRAVFWMSSSLVITAVVMAFLFDVEQTGFARGILRVAGGVQSVPAQASGVVLEVAAKSGDIVTQGSLLARIDSAQTRQQLVESEKQIELAEQKLQEAKDRRSKVHKERIKLLEQRAGLLGARAGNQQRTVARLREKQARVGKLVAEGLTSQMQGGDVADEVSSAERETLRLQEEYTATKLQIASLAADLDAEDLRLAADVKQAKDRREALAVQVTQTEVRAPRGGRLEALLVKVGDAVSVGTAVSKMVPTDAPRQVVVFVPERDRAFLLEGAEGRIEVDQLPSGEFGTLRGKVTRIASDLASPTEIGEALGDAKLGEPVFRVELTLEASESLSRLEQLLRPGSLVTARFALRKRRIITVLFEPLRRFFA